MAFEGRRSIPFKANAHDRFWWFKTTGATYVPPIFDFLADNEWDVLHDWYEETERRYEYGTGECNVSAMTMIMGLLMGNNISRVVQCGHFIGFSTLLLGFMLRRMGHAHGLYSIDLDPGATSFTARWVERANLTDTVHLKVANSSDPELPALAEDYLHGRAQVVFIDSSHEYRHTLEELDLWLPKIQPSGFAILHDVSKFAAGFDAKGGGVRRAVNEWVTGRGLQSIMINDFITSDHVDPAVYLDGCGLGIIQKPS